MKSSSEWRKVIYHSVIPYLIRNLSVWCFNNQHWQTFPIIQSRYLLRLALNGYTQIQIEKILFPIMNFRFSHLSWISSMLTEFRQRNSVPKASICSLFGMNAVQKFALLGLPKNLMQTQTVIQSRRRRISSKGKSKAC